MSIGELMGEPAPKMHYQSEAARRIARGVRRCLGASGWSTVEELRLPDGRRADIVGVLADGSIAIVEVKSSVADFRADRKWGDYMEFCDRLYFAVDLSTPREIIPPEMGLIVADDFGAQFVRHGGERRLSAPRRKSMILRFARTAADRLHGLHDPHFRTSER